MEIIINFNYFNKVNYFEIAVRSPIAKDCNSLISIVGEWPSKISKIFQYFDTKYQFGNESTSDE